VGWVAGLSSGLECGRVVWPDLSGYEGVCVDLFRLGVQDERARRTAFADLQAKLVQQASAPRRKP
jgi:hypothetical protein